MRCKFPYNENFMVFAKKHAGRNGNLIINFAWPNLISTDDQVMQTIANNQLVSWIMSGTHNVVL